jgi:hypothetical protein
MPQLDDHVWSDISMVWSMEDLGMAVNGHPVPVLAVDGHVSHCVEESKHLRPLKIRWQRMARKLVERSLLLVVKVAGTQVALLITS